MKTDTVFKRAFNDALDLLSKFEGTDPFPSENAVELAARGQPDDRAKGPIDIDRPRFGHPFRESARCPAQQGSDASLS